ncbi:head-tail connector protein [Sagittula stellata]|uniref:Phage gp6-like head-tail connector protein n=1 Tax=Sagittula stellata (strain ATCC 700073 / DSM 11524 / E-37) TaxID=388399 RepID=A3KA56_SAGS3|nr:hypothetical protein [Sagittula stellata]EBA05999.1 hypothetical protein SSE37_25363 [Sagittula stellata E-37]
MRLTRTADPAVLPVAVADVKAYLRILHADEDETIELMIGAAVDYLDGPTGILGRPIISQTWEVALAEWPTADLPLPLSPVSSAAVSYDDAEGVDQALSSDAWDVSPLASLGTNAARPVFAFRSDTERPVLADTPFPVRISLTGGAADADAVLQGVKTLVIMLAGYWFESKPTGSPSLADLPPAICAMMARYRVPL